LGEYYEERAGDRMINSILELCRKREPMPQLSVEERINNFYQIELGYSEKTLRSEASRCLQCEEPPCVEACPAHLNIKKYVLEAREGRYRDALGTILERLPLPSTCGRVCPHPCEDACVRYTHFDPISIRGIKRFIADQFMEADWYPKIEEIREERVAVIGSGPAGLTVARNLALSGYRVTIFDSSPNLGGMIAQSIPHYRLPPQFPRKEIEEIKKLGVGFQKGTLGKDFTLNSLFDQGYKAIFVGIGTHKGMKMNIPGEDLEGVHEALDLLRDIKAGKTLPQFKGKKAIVVGGGNVAMDAVRSIRRLGADVTLVYRRSWEEMPAGKDEVQEAKEEGIEFKILTNPTKILGSGRVEGLECIRMELGEPDASGRRRPVPVEGSGFGISADFFIEAIGEGPESEMLKSMGVELDKRGLVKVDDNMKTNMEGVFAAGDLVSGPAIVIEAVAGGLRAAESIDEYCQSKGGKV
jgi:NADPH-dependent glutamate synthase beta subunit-like oxidoreductase